MAHDQPSEILQFCFKLDLVFFGQFEATANAAGKF
jgi:hypothetical protein